MYRAPRVEGTQSPSLLQPTGLVPSRTTLITAEVFLFWAGMPTLRVTRGDGVHICSEFDLSPSFNARGVCGWVHLTSRRIWPRRRKSRHSDRPPAGNHLIRGGRAVYIVFCCYRILGGRSANGPLGNHPWVALGCRMIVCWDRNIHGRGMPRL